MTMSDPIADMLTRIRNANTAKHDTVDVDVYKRQEERMKKAILATKVGMTQIFNEDGQLIPVTVLQAGP